MVFDFLKEQKSNGAGEESYEQVIHNGLPVSGEFFVGKMSALKYKKTILLYQGPDLPNMWPR